MGSLTQRPICQISNESVGPMLIQYLAVPQVTHTANSYVKQTQNTDTEFRP